MQKGNAKPGVEERPGQMGVDKYNERVKVLRYSIGFAGSAVAFLITAKTKLGLDFSMELFKYILFLWGATIFTGFLAYILSYREVWYLQRLPIKGLRRKFFFPIELTAHYIVITLHPLLMITSICLSVYSLWGAFN